MILFVLEPYVDGQYTFTIAATPSQGKLVLARLYLFKISAEPNFNVSLYYGKKNLKISFLTIADKKHQWATFALGDAFLSRIVGRNSDATRINIKVHHHKGTNETAFFKNDVAWLALIRRKRDKPFHLKNAKHPDLTLTPADETFPQKDGKGKNGDVHSSPSGECCQKRDFFINTSEHGMDWIIKPRIINRYICEGKCSYSPRLTEEEFISRPQGIIGRFRSGIPRKICLPSKYKRLALLTADGYDRFVISWPQNMAIENCSCQ